MASQERAWHHRRGMASITQLLFVDITGGGGRDTGMQAQHVLGFGR